MCIRDRARELPTPPRDDRLREGSAKVVRVRSRRLGPAGTAGVSAPEGPVESRGYAGTSPREARSRLRNRRPAWA
eukprot:315044-Alexandrium_andersonii.AAC.1